MSLARWYPWAVLAWVALAAGSGALLWFVPAPYGRHRRAGWGPELDPRLAWLIMEAPASLVFGSAFLLSGPSWAPEQLAFVILWETHYIYRAFIYPQRLRSRSKASWSIVASGCLYNLVNGLLHGYELFLFPTRVGAGWLVQPVFWIGALFFLLGLLVNRHAHRALRRQRAVAGVRYVIPTGGLYGLVSSPNYLGEIVQWIGWALATWSLAGLSFAIWTMANLVPRARANHRWYRTTFPDYPAERRALIPRVW